jgi:TolA-binding protein
MKTVVSPWRRVLVRALGQPVRPWRLASALIALFVAAAVCFSAQGSEDLARRTYDSGLSFVQNGRYAEALKDFQSVVDSFPQSSVADDALLQIALYQLESGRDLTAAQTAVDRLLKDYPASDSAPMGYVVVGRLSIARGRAPADVDAALASFERVPRLFPNSPAVAAARFFAGDTLRVAGRRDDAMAHFRRIELEYPQSIWAARADLASAANLVASERAAQAFERLQRIRQQFPGTREADTALNYNTILYRLYLRKPAYRFSGRFVGAATDRFRDVTGVAIDETGRVLIGHKQGVAIFDAKGTPLKGVPGMEPSAFFVDGRDRVVVVRGFTFYPDGATPVVVNVPVPGRVARQPEEIPAVITLSGGDRLVVDRKAKTVLRLTPAGKFVANFAAIDVERLARNDVDDVAMIDRQNKSIALADRDGRILARIPAKGPNYQLDDPSDVAFDALGHLYVLDGNRAAIHVFGPKNRLITSITVPGRDPGSLQRPRALAIDPAGRLFVFDDSTQRVQVYQ